MANITAGATGDTAAYEFDDAWYRSAYGDVQAAVQAGAFASAEEHYLRFGLAEGRFPCARADEDKRMGRGLYRDGGAVPDSGERRARVETVWSSASEADTGWFWMAHPMVGARLNRLVSGNPGVDSYGRLAELLAGRGMTMPIARAVSLGCGFGELERELAVRNYIGEIDAYDIAPGAIDAARRKADELGLSNLRYHVADLETITFEPGSVDVVFAHQSVHHVERLDELFATVAAMLKPEGVFHLHEFVGPDRFQWTDAQIEGVNRFLDSLPPRLRALPSGERRPPQGRATVAAMIAADPSEAIRSSQILPALRRHFSILEERPLGGALLHLGLAGIAQNFDPDSAKDRGVLEEFFAAEDEAMRAGIVGSDIVVVTAVRPSRKTD